MEMPYFVKLRWRKNLFDQDELQVHFGNDGIEYYHGHIVEALKAENEKLRKQIQRWEDAHPEMIGEVELRARIAELEAIIEARGM